MRLAAVTSSSGSRVAGNNTCFELVCLGAKFSECYTLDSKLLLFGGDFRPFFLNFAPLLQFEISVDLVFWWCLGWHAKAFAGPSSKIDVLATLTAKWAESIA